MAKDNGHYIGLDRNNKLPEGHKGGHYISGVQTEEGNHKDGKRWLKGKKRPDLDALEAGDPDNNAINIIPDDDDWGQV